MSNPSSGHPTFTLWAQGQQVALSEGVSLERAQFPMLVPANPGGPVALVNANPNDPTQLGLRNLTTSPWTATLPDGSSKEIGTDKSVRLAAGTVIQAGPLQWEIRAQFAPSPFASPPPAPSPFVSPPVGAGFVATSEPAIAPQPVMPPQAGFLQANPSAAPPAGVGFIQDNAPPAPPPAGAGYVLGTPPPPMGFVQNNAPVMPGQPPHRPGGAARNVILSSSLSFSKILPVFGERKALMGKGFLIPGIVTAITVALMFYTIGNSINKDNSINFDALIEYCKVIAVYIGCGLLFVIYRLCGKSKPWWLILAPIVFTYFWLTAGDANSPMQLILKYHVISLAGEPNENDPNVLHKLIQFTFSVGVREELTKALPVLLLFFFAPKLASPLREKIGVFEPIDGIILGAASGLGFTFGETLGQYVPNSIVGIAQQTGDPGAGAMVGVMLVSARLLSEISGHLAYSGCFGYFIGLAALMPKHKWKLFGLGLLTAIVLHGFWDATADTSLLMVVEGAISYAFLIAAILKARELSPDRAHNFATQIKGVS